MAGEVAVRAQLNRTLFQALPTAQKAYLLLDIVPMDIGQGIPLPLNLCLVLDRSGSMAGAKIRNLREAVKLVLNSLSPEDYITVVLFDDNVDTLVACQPLSDLQQVQAQVERIIERGGTTLSKGMRRGIDEMRQGLAPDRVSRMVLLTDGETYGDTETCRQLGVECGQYGIAVSALGLGDDWNMPLLESIGQSSGGNVDYLEAPERIMVEFQQAVRSMQGTVVRNTRLTLRLAAGVTTVAAWRALPAIAQLNQREIAERDVHLVLGDLERGKGQSLLIELMVQPRPAGTYRIAQADVTYDVPSAVSGGEHLRQDILVELTDDPNRVSPLEATVMNLVEKISIFKLQTRALNEATAGNTALATQQLRATATRLLNMGEAELAEAAMQEAANLEQGRQVSSGGTRKLEYRTRRLTQRLDGDDTP